MCGRDVRLALAATLLACALPSVANGSRKDDELRATEVWRLYHPDQHHRDRAMAAYERDEFADAYRQFLRAAYYADKPSQAALAEMLWQGIGVERDRAAAYGWADLAAERGYTAFLAQRERYWSQLTDDERARALKMGAGIYAGYGDEVAKPRLERELRKGDKWAYASVTHRAYARVSLKNADGWGYTQLVTGFYEPKYWQPRQYWQWQDAIWREPAGGTVRVGPLEVAP